MFARHLGLALALSLTPLQYALSQTLRGQRIDSIGGHAVPGGFIVLLDTEDREVARTLAGAAGAFVIRAPAPGTYRLRSERIGYRTSISPPLDLAAAETRDYAFRVTPIPVRLAAIEVRDERHCSARPDDDAATAAVWEEVRKALAAARWSAQQGGYATRLLRYERDLDADRRKLRSQEIQTKSGSMLKNPFSSIPAQDLAVEGFVVERNDEIWYYAPDAEVLLDNAFLNTHCFQVIRGGRRDRGLIGLAFEPALGRRLPDVDGVLWLDLETAELRTLDYRYTNLAYDLRDDRVGGTIEFLQLPSGMWIVREWQIRIPRIGLEGRRDPLTSRQPKAKVMGFHDSGGEVFEISAHQGVPVYRAQMASIVGSIAESAGDRPLPNATITVDGLDFSAVADDSGAFELGLPLDGEYTILVEHPRLDSIGLRVLQRTVSLKRGSTTRLTIAIPAAERVHRELCPDDEPDDRALFGVVGRGRLDTPVPDARVAARWQRIAMSSGTPSVTNVGAVATTDDSGFFVLCGLPFGRTILVNGYAGDLASHAASVFFSPEVGGSVLLAWDKPVGAPYESIHTTPHRGFRLDLRLAATGELPSTTSAALSGLVVDASTAEPLPGVHVSVTEIDTALTRIDGTYAIDDLVWDRGRRWVTFRHLGYEPTVHDLLIDAPDTTVVLNVTMEPSAVQLEEIVIAGERMRIPPYLRGFYERRARGWGVFLDAQQIAERSGPRVLDVLLTIPGVDLKGQRRNVLYLRGASRTCQAELRAPIIVVDGTPFRGLQPGVEVGALLDAINVHVVVGIEVYRGPSEIPPEFGRLDSQCGMVVIWTK